MNLTELTQQRLEYLDNLLKPVPENFKSDEQLDQPMPLKKIDYIYQPAELWLKNLVDFCRWYPGLFPGRPQCQNQEQVSRWESIDRQWQSLISTVPSVDPNEALIPVLISGLYSLRENRWVHDYLRPDQIEAVKNARRNMSFNVQDYSGTFASTTQYFSSEPSFDFFLNSPVFNYASPSHDNKMQLVGLQNANVMDAPTGTGKTRMSLVANISSLCIDNEMIALPFKKVAVFVRTRSQTQAFLKESGRLGLSVSCPISTSLGCWGHNSKNREFAKNLIELLKMLKAPARLQFEKPQLLKYIPVELYLPVAENSDSCLALAEMLPHLYAVCKEHQDFDILYSKWRVWYEDKEFDENFTPLYNYLLAVDLDTEAHALVDYIGRAEGNCSTCPSNTEYLNKAVGREAIEEYASLFGNHEDSNFFEQRLSKNADINSLAEEFQDRFGTCGRAESRKDLKTATVVIFTYNWLLDPRIAEHTRSALGLSNTELNYSVAAICDEAHTLYDFNSRFFFSAQSIFDHVGNLWKAKVQYFDQAEFEIPSIGDVKVLNPSFNAEQEVWSKLDIQLRDISKIIVECSNTGIDDMPTPHKLFQLATGIDSKWYPKQFYMTGSLDFDFTKAFKKDKVKRVEISYKCCNILIKDLEKTIEKYKNHVETNEAAISLLIESREIDDSLEAFLNDNVWLAKAYQNWIDKGRKGKVVFERNLNKIANEPYELLLKVLTFVLEFTLMLRECIYSISENCFDARVLSISAVDRAYSTLTPYNIHEGALKGSKLHDSQQLAVDLNYYLGLLHQVGAATTREWESMQPEDLVTFFTGFSHAAMKDLKPRKQLSHIIQASFKVNSPLIQTALHPYSCITFLTGTPAPLDLWKSKSGFKYMFVSQYPAATKNFDYDFVEKFEIKQSTKSPELYLKIAEEVMSRTTDERVLVVYPSKGTMKEVIERFTADYSKSILVESPEVNIDKMQAYLESRDAGSLHVVAGGRFVEGIEFTDDSGSSLIKKAILVGVPFNPPTEENRQIENYYKQRYGWDEWMAMDMLMYQPVYQKVRQAMGRTIRNLTDQATIVFLDSRYTKSKMLKRALKL